MSLTEFSYNNAQHVSIDCLLFYVNYDYDSQFNIDLHSFVKYPISAVKDMVDRLKNLHKDLIEFIKITQNQQAKYYNIKHKRVEYEVGDKIYLLSQNIRTQHPSKKLDWKHLGPYPILEQIEIQIYRLKFLSFMKIHSVFHVSLLDRFIESDIPEHIQPPSPSVIVKDQVEYEVEDHAQTFVLPCQMKGLFSVR